MSSGAVVANTVLGIDGLSTIGQLCVWGVWVTKRFYVNSLVNDDSDCLKKTC